MELQLPELLNELDEQEKEILILGKDLMKPGGDVLPLDLLVIGVLNRSLSLITAFGQLIRSDNFIAASHLVRLHLDSYLRLYSAWLVQNPQEFAMKVLRGDRIDTMEARDGKKMRDSHLAKKASEEFPWMLNVYKVSSGFVHLSRKHVFTSINADTDKGLLEFRLHKLDKFVPLESKIEAVSGMIEITRCICGLIVKWINAKTPNSVE